MTKEESKEFVKKMFEVTAKNAIMDMKGAKLFFLTRDGKFFNDISGEYIEKMKKYSVYCKEEKKDNWTKSVETLIDMAGEVDDYSIESQLHAYENAGEIMEYIANGESWEEINRLTHEQGHCGVSISLLGQIMLSYSTEGINFAEKVIGKEWIKLLDNVNKEYKKEKRKAKNKELRLNMNI